MHSLFIRVRAEFRIVPPAELESVLLTHPDIADSAVIGVDSVEEATELPRFVLKPLHCSNPMIFNVHISSAYVVHAHPEKVKTPEAKALFAKSVVQWMETKVAKHKFLRGGLSFFLVSRFQLAVMFSPGVDVIDIIPKR